MRCDKCRDEAVFFQPYSGRHLCGRHLALDIETRAKHSIRSHRWMSPGDHIAVLVSGDRKTAALLSFLKKLTADRRDIRLSAVPACGADKRMSSRSAAIMVAESLRIPCIEMPLSGGAATAAQEKVIKIALAISLDDIAQGVLGQFLFGNAGRLMHPSSAGSSPLPVICPFIAVPSDELDLYWEIGGTGIDLPPGISPRDTIPQETRAILEDYSRFHPATKYAILHLAEQLSSGDAAATAIAGAIGPGTGETKIPSPQKRPNS
jgi:tRNA(Ile)-lysidine synthase TilS/MesJ